MTRRDKFAKPPRPEVARYWAFCEECRVRRLTFPAAGACVVFELPMPRSWSAKRRREAAGTPHQSRPDLSNLLKALEDAVYEEDSVIWDIRPRKVWGESGAIHVGVPEL